jgi:hypothetical protein
MRRKKFYVESKYCVLCDEQVEKSMIHLFFSRDFSQKNWWKIGEEWNVDLNIIEMITEAEDRSTKEAMVSGCWSIWNQRNSIIFEGG